MKSFKLFVEAFKPTDTDYKYVYDKRKEGKTDIRIRLGDQDIGPFSVQQHKTFKKYFDSEEAKKRSDYHPPAADNRSGLTDSHYNQVYRLRYSGHPETHIQKTMGIHKDTIAKYIDSDDAKTRSNYHPPVRKLK